MRWKLPARDARDANESKVAFLVSTVTYMAYSNYHWLFHQRYAEASEGWATLERSDVFLQEHNEFGLSTYDTHSDGSGVRYASRLRPVLNMAPKTHLWSFNADTHILGWLENRGIEYDVITDEDLHEEGAAAAGCGTIARCRTVSSGSPSSTASSSTTTLKRPTRPRHFARWHRSTPAGCC